MAQPFSICFPQGTTALAIQADDLAELAKVVSSLGLQSPRPVIVVVGGANDLRHYHVARLRSLFVKVLAPLAQALDAIVIDGGTDTGVMRMMGTARARTHATFPLVGILPGRLAIFPDTVASSEVSSSEAARLEPNHSHFILGPGRHWGDESPWIAEVAGILSLGAPTVTVLMNGGDVTWKDATESIEAGRPIVAVAGSGRAADELVSALNGKVTDERARKILSSGLLQAVSIENDQGLEEAIQQILVRPVEDEWIETGTRSPKIQGRI